MTEESSFLGNTTPTAEAQTVAPVQAGDQPSNSEYTELLAAITNPEGKQKYKSVADALLGHVRAEEHIRRLEQETAELRTVKTKVDTLEQVLQRLESGKPTDQGQLRVEDQESLIAAVMEKRETAKKAEENRKQTLNAIRAKFGEKVDQVLTQKAEELGLTVSELGDLAARSPKAVLAHFNVDARGTPSVLGTVNTQALQPRNEPAVAPANILWGASTKEVVGFMRQIKDEVTKELGL